MRQAKYGWLLLALFAAACGGSSSTPVCSNTCTAAGTTQCSGAQVETCNADANGCLAWGAALSCGSNQFCDGAQNKCATCSSACTVGATQCSGAQVETCSMNSVGCPAFGAATACPSGQACGGASNGCVDICTTSAVQSACASAALNVNQDCSGGSAAVTGDSFCHAIVTAGLDPQVTCSQYTAANQATLHATYKSEGACCCPSGQFCDLEDSGWACQPKCTTSADCAAVAGRTACAPSIDPSKDAPIKAPYICKANDGGNWHGCGFRCSDPQHYCYADANANLFCSRLCTTDTQCGNPEQACCNLTASHGTGSGDACGVCQ